MKLFLQKLKRPKYAYWQKKYVQSIKDQDFEKSLICLKNISKSFGGLMPHYWVLELAKVRISLGQFDKALEVIEKFVDRVENNSCYNHDTRLFLLKHLEKIHSQAIKGKFGVSDAQKIEGVTYVDSGEINFQNVDSLLREGWPLGS